MRSTPDQTAALMKPNAGAIDAAKFTAWKPSAVGM
jgi:hypothetical protein